MANPVVDAIDAGHVERAGVCKFDQERWPCVAILRARRDLAKQNPIVRREPGKAELVRSGG